MMNATVEKPLIRIDSEVTRRVRRHARAHMQTEVCGVLIGKMCDGVIEIEAPIEAVNAAQAGAHVTFTQAAWETIYRVKDKQYPDERIVGWYHSHPGFGVFLSDHDTFIHRHFFSSPDQVAWVYDPHSDEEGCFAWVDGSIRRIGSMFIADNSGEEPQRARKRADGLAPEGAPFQRSWSGAGPESASFVTSGGIRSGAGPESASFVTSGGIRVGVSPAASAEPNKESAETRLSVMQRAPNRPPFLRRLLLFAGHEQEAVVALLYFGRAVQRWFAPANDRLLSARPLALPSGQPGVQGSTSSNTPGGEVTEQLSPEGGQ